MGLHSFRREESEMVGSRAWVWALHELIPALWGSKHLSGEYGYLGSRVCAACCFLVCNLDGCASVVYVTWSCWEAVYIGRQS